MKSFICDKLGKASQLSWHCLKCGLPNLSSLLVSATPILWDKGICRNSGSTFHTLVKQYESNLAILNSRPS